MLSKSNFKILPILIGFILCNLVLAAQDHVDSSIQTSFKNWNHFHQSGDYTAAVKQAQVGFEFAEKAANRPLMAEALYKEGLSLLKLTKRLNKNRKLAKAQLEKGLFHLARVDAPDLKIKIIEQLLWIAKKQKEIEQIAIYQNQILQIKALEKASAKNEVLAENKTKLENKVNTLAVQKKVLSNRVKSLTEEQLESELLIALQKNQVDSLGFQILKDSFLLQQKELVLSDQANKLELQNSQIELQNSMIDLQKSQRNFFLALAGIVGLLAIGAVMRYLETKKHYATLQAKNEIIKEEKHKSEQLLLNILPAVVANELKVNGVAKARKYDNATVLFSDFKNFSAIAESLSPERLVHELDFYFKTFDDIIGKYNLEKIKTIGDAYMCVGGLPEENANNPLEMVEAALEIQSYLTALKLQRAEKGEPFFEARIGIHTGPLVAGVVGSRKFAYDVWGDTVNVAARLESKSEAGKVNISSTTYEVIKNKFNCEFRGKIPIKNRGEVDMYFVEGLVG